MHGIRNISNSKIHYANTVISVFCTDLKLNSDYSLTLHYLISFCNAERACLLHGMIWIFKGLVLFYCYEMLMVLKVCDIYQNITPPHTLHNLQASLYLYRTCLTSHIMKK
jgi:hypothetical protein